MVEHSNESAVLRFGFGRNWKGYSRLVDERRIESAGTSLREMLEQDDLSGLTFLDIGSGSGLFSLAARRSGAHVHSFDFDGESVSCTAALKAAYAGEDPRWEIEQASILDRAYVERLGRFDIVYSWGVLHHTGRMWEALDNATQCVAVNGRLFIALYNDQGRLTDYWKWVKRLYNRNAAYRCALIGVHAPYFVALRWLVRRLKGRGEGQRGMSLWYDMVDWLGGYPFEAARPGEVLEFLRSRGFELIKLVTCGGRHGCNEYVFMKR